MRFEKKAALALCATFMAMLIVPLMATDLRPGVVSEIENRTLKPFPALFDADGGRNRDLISGFEGWFDDHIGFREEMFTLNARIQYDLFHSSGSERVRMPWKSAARLDAPGLALSAAGAPGIASDLPSALLPG